MNRILGRVVTVLAAGLGLAAVMPACAKNDESIFIRALLAPSGNRIGGACIWTADPQQPALFEPLLDVGVRDNYFGIFLIGNQMISRGDPASPTTEANRIHINGVVATLTNTDGSPITEFTSYAEGVVDPQDNNTPSFEPIGASIVDAPTANNLLSQLPNRQASKTILINVKAFGTTLGGVDVESGEFQVPMTVCNGCTVDFTQGNDTTQQPQPNCLKPFDPTANATQNPCFPGQDVNTPCQICQGKPACNPATP